MTVTPVSDPCVGNLATPVNSGYFIKALISNLPFYRPGISPNFRGLETGAAFGYLLYGPFTICGPLRATEYQQTAGLLAAIGAVHILSPCSCCTTSPANNPTSLPLTPQSLCPLRTSSPEPDGPTSPVVSGWEVAVAPSLPGSSATPFTFRICSRSLLVFGASAEDVH